VLVPVDNADDIYVAVTVNMAEHSGLIMGWLRGSEGKLPQFYRKGRWVIPPEALHDMDELPGKEKLKTMPPYSAPSKGEETCVKMQTI
jgi:hypothetical protein